MLPEEFFAGLADNWLTSFFDAFVAIVLSPLAAVANIVYTFLGGT